MTIAIVTGVLGQDGAYLTRFLLDKGYTVHGSYRRASTLNLWRLHALDLVGHPRLHLVEGDVTDASACIRLLSRVQPDEVYNLAAQSFVGVSFEQPLATSQITGVAVVNLLEAIRIVNPSIRFYQASTSEMFGLVHDTPQNEQTPFYPRSPYAIAKLFAHWMTVNYRESYGLFAVSGILFNHESPLRGIEFVTRKIAAGVVAVDRGTQECLELGNLGARRDWGYAPEYVDGIWRMLQTESPDTYVLATGRDHDVRDFVAMAFQAVGRTVAFRGEGVDEVALDVATDRIVARVSPRYFRPAEVDTLLGDATKAFEQLGWRAETRLEALCHMMVQAEIDRADAGQMTQ